MYINVIGVIKNLRMETIGYRLLDTDDNNNKTMDVKREQLLSVLISNKIKVENIKLNDGKIQGKYYSVELLPKICGEDMEYKKILLLNVIDNLYATITNCVGEVHKITLAQLQKIAPAVINIIDNDLKCDNITTEYFKQRVDSAERLDKESIDKNKEWSFDDFDMFMKNHGYSYIIREEDKESSRQIFTKEQFEKAYNPTLFRIDDRCKVIHLPKGLMEIANIYNEPNKVIEYFILPYTLHTIRNICYDENTQGQNMVIKRIYFQQSPTGCSDSSFRLNGLHNITFENTVEMPNTISINGGFKECVIPNLVFNNTKPCTVRDCFHETTFKNSVFSTRNIKSLAYSFRDSKGIQKLIVDEVTQVIESYTFESSDIIEIDFSNAKSLKTFGGFARTGVKSIDFSNCENLQYLTYSSFLDSNKLTSVIFNEGLLRISVGCFNGTALSKVDLPHSLLGLENCFISELISDIFVYENINKIEHPVGGKNTVIHFNGSDRTFTKELRSELKDITKLDFGNTFSCIARDALEGLRVDLAFPSSITKLMPGALSHINAEVFDTKIMPNIDEIRLREFQYSYTVKTFIFNDNIKKIGENVFYGAGNIQRVIIGKNVEYLDKSAFTRMDNKSIPPKFYVFRSNEYVQKVMNSKKIPYILIDDYNEAMPQSTETSEAVKAKFNLILGNNSKYNELLQPEYINNVELLYKLIKELENRHNVTWDTSELNVQKFINLPINTYQTIADGCMKFRKLQIEGYEADEDKIGCFEDKFIGLCNFITTLYNNNQMCYTNEFISNAIKFGNATIERTLYSGVHSEIIIAKMSINNRVNNKILMITIDDNIVFQIPFNYDKVIDVYPTSRINLASRSEKLGCVGLANYMIEGDFFKASDEARIGGAKVPSTYLAEILEAIHHSWILLGHKEQKGQFDSKKPCDALVYDIKSQKFIEISGIFQWYSCRINSIIQFVVKRVLSLNYIYYLDKEYIKDCLNAVNDEFQIRALRLYSMTADEIDKICKDESKFTYGGNESICKAADIVYSEGASTVSNLTAKALSAIYNTSFVENVKTSIATCDKKGYSREIQMLSPEYMLLHYTLPLRNTVTNENLEYIAVVKPGTPKTKTDIMRQTIVPLQNIVSVLYNIGSFRANNRGQISAEEKIHNNTINIDNYSVIMSCNDAYYSNNLIKYLLAVDKSNGDTYILGEVADTDFYKLFRFKNLNSGTLWYLKIMSNRFDKDELGCLVKQLNGNQDANSGFSEVRDSIMNGLPDNYPYFQTKLDLFKDLAKQMK